MGIGRGGQPGGAELEAVARTEVDLDLNAAVVRWEVRILLLHPRSHRGALRMRGASQITQRVG